jgi:hypothetical protein
MCIHEASTKDVGVQYSTNIPEGENDGNSHVLFFGKKSTINYK